MTSLCYGTHGVTAECRAVTDKKPHELINMILAKAKESYPKLIMAPDHIQITNYDEYFLIKVFMYEDPIQDLFEKRRQRIPANDVILYEILSIFM